MGVLYCTIKFSLILLPVNLGNFSTARLTLEWCLNIWTTKTKNRKYYICYWSMYSLNFLSLVPVFYLLSRYNIMSSCVLVRLVSCFTYLYRCGSQFIFLCSRRESFTMSEDVNNMNEPQGYSKFQHDMVFSFPGNNCFKMLTTFKFLGYLFSTKRVQCAEPQQILAPSWYLLRNLLVICITKNDVNR